MYGVQDAIETFVYNQTNSSEAPVSISLLSEEMTEAIHAMVESAKEIVGQVMRREEGEEQEEDPLTEKAYGESNKIVGQEEDLDQMMKMLLKEGDGLVIVPITGLAGIGKTTLARSIYESSIMVDRFDVRAWVTVSEEYSGAGDIFLKLLGSLETKGKKSDASGSVKAPGDNKASRRSRELVNLRQSLFSRRYLIVIDDIWTKYVWDEIKHAFQDDKNGSRVVVTTRNVEVAEYVRYEQGVLEMRPLSQKKSWELLCERAFSGGKCPPPLERIGRKIAGKCGGIPLTITMVGGRLSRETKRAEHWESVEEDLRGASSKYEDFYLEILSQSYNHLPSFLKGCFLYMGAFPEDSEIHVSKLLNLWLAEGFVQLPQSTMCLERIAKVYLRNLIDRNLISVLRSSSNGQIKTCTMQGSLRKLALRECQREQFLHVEDGKAREGTESERRISVHKNILMCIQGITQSTVSNNKLARTLLYAGPNHHHPMPFPSALHLLRVLDALSVYFIEFPSELFELIHLRYLSFTCDEDLPPEISKLRNLLVLIVSQHPKTIFRCASVLPVEIWNLPQMRHLRFQEIYLADPLPQGNSVLLENLQYLSNVNAASCTRENVRNMPNLKTLKIWVEEPGQVDLNLDQLHFLDALKFTVLKPIPGRAVEFTSGLFFPETLTKLSLSGCALSWEDAAVIQLCAPNLEVLKLRELAFQGEEWILDEDEKYRRLKFLLLESLDLKVWDATYSNFPRLERLIIRHCYALELINPELGDIGGLQLMELVHCSPQAVEWAEEVRQERNNPYYYQLRIFPEK